MSIDVAVVPFPLGSFRATVDEGVVRAATFDFTPQPRAATSSVWTTCSTSTSPARSTRSTASPPKATARRSSVTCGSGSARSRPATPISYGELARRVGKPNAQRAVGMANAANPIALIVPCHRVIRTGGALGGYAFGLELKRWLLEHESNGML